MLGWNKSINVWDGLCKAKTDAGIDIGKSGGDYIGEGMLLDHKLLIFIIASFYWSTFNNKHLFVKSQYYFYESLIKWVFLTGHR